MPYHDPTPSPTLPHYRDGLGDDTGRYLKVDGGYIEYRFTPGWGVEIVNIEVDATRRRTGVGRTLLRQLCDLAVANGCHTVYAVTRSSNLIAHDWYAAMGFWVCGRLQGFYDPENITLDALLFARNCKEPIP